MAHTTKTRFNFTDRSVASLKSTGTRREVADTSCPGLVCRVSRKDDKKFFMVYARYPGSDDPTRRAIGQFGRIMVADAQRKARDWFALIKRGIDPQVEEERLLREQQRAHADKFGEAMERYIAENSDEWRRSVRSAREIRRNLGVWADRPIRDIAARDVIDRIEEVIKGSGPHEARSAWNHCSALFKWAVHHDLIDLSPCASVSKKELFKRTGIKPRERVLSDEELFALWRATQRLPYPYGPFYRLLLLTATRLNELAQARWSEFRLDLGLWTIPAERDKTGREHPVALSDAALAELKNLPRIPGVDLLFTYGRVPIRAVERAKRQLDARMLRTLKALARTRGAVPKSVMLPRWVNHDLRRVVRTNLGMLKVPFLVAELALGHSKKGVHGVYDRHGYIDEQRTAMNAWAKRLRSIVAPPPPRTRRKVVPLRPRRRA